MAQDDMRDRDQLRGAEQTRMFGLSAPVKGTDERYTPPEILEAVAHVWPEGIGVDPAWSPDSLVKAETTFTKDDDGKHRAWGDRTWLNPPFSDPSFWVGKLSRSCIANDWEGMMITRLDPAASWFTWHYTGRRFVLFDERTRFFKPGEGRMGTPEFCCGLSYFGTRVRRFNQAFSKLGKVLVP